MKGAERREEDAGALLRGWRLWVGRGYLALWFSLLALGLVGAGLTWWLFFRESDSVQYWSCMELELGDNRQLGDPHVFTAGNEVRGFQRAEETCGQFRPSDLTTEDAMARWHGMWVSVVRPGYFSFGPGTPSPSL